MRSAPSVLVISSQVAAGPVGASAAGPGILSRGVTPVIVPTIFLSNHPGHGRPEGLSIDPSTMKAMLERLLELGFLADCKTVLTGYFATADQVAAAADFVDALLQHMPGLYLLCDPVLGDDDELYVKEETAIAIRDRLVPIAHGLVPNVFEAGWLIGTTIHTHADAARAASHWPQKEVIITSIPDRADHIATAVFSRHGNCVATRPRLKHVPHGTGDLLSGLLAGYLAKGISAHDALPQAMARLDRVIAASHGSECLDLARGLTS